MIVWCPSPAPVFLNDLGSNRLSRGYKFQAQRLLAEFQCLSWSERTTGPVRSLAEVDEFEAVDRGVPRRLDPGQCAPELVGGCPARARKDHPADGEGEGDDDPRGREAHNADEDGDEQRRPGDDRGSPGQREPPAALDRRAQVLDLQLEPLDLIHQRGVGLTIDMSRSIAGSARTRASLPDCAMPAALFGGRFLPLGVAQNLQHPVDPGGRKADQARIGRA
jgi:hypothetical protein